MHSRGLRSMPHDLEGPMKPPSCPWYDRTGIKFPSGPSSFFTWALPKRGLYTLWQFSRFPADLGSQVQILNHHDQGTSVPYLENIHQWTSAWPLTFQSNLSVSNQRPIPGVLEIWPSRQPAFKMVPNNPHHLVFTCLLFSPTLHQCCSPFVCVTNWMWQSDSVSLMRLDYKGLQLPSGILFSWIPHSGGSHTMSSLMERLIR